MNKEQREAMRLQQIENLSKYTISNQNFSCSQKLIPQNKNWFGQNKRVEIKNEVSP